MQSKELFDISGRKALVTGAGRGIGKVLALTLAKAGCDVALLGLHRENLESVAVQIRGTGRAAQVLTADVAQKEQVFTAFQQLEEKFGRLDICVNNAGISLQEPAEEMKEEDWDRIIDINMKGVFLCSQAAARLMIPRRSGVIINIGSISGSVVNVPQKQGVYNTSKAGVVMLTRSLAVEWAPYGLRVNSLSPGYIKTEMTLQAMSHLFPTWESLTPMGRLGETDDLQGPLIFLASDASRYMTGHDLIIDGGYTVR
ncbi:MAG TPA: SDR family oxidoreductase [Dehalococcoidales bacterium]|nr:SDR family oxidoreductase [Dehalococcoidales bacterium]